MTKAADKQLGFMMESEAATVPAAAGLHPIFPLILLSAVNGRKVSSFPEAGVKTSKIQQLHKTNVSASNAGFARQTFSAKMQQKSL